MAPQSISTVPLPKFGKTGARAARLIPLMRFAMSVAPDKSAPVLPAETMASAFSSRKSLRPTAIEESFLSLKTVLGSSSISTFSVAFISSIFVLSPKRGLISSSFPTSNISTPSIWDAKIAASTAAMGALSPPIASRTIFTENLPFFDFVYTFESPSGNS